MHLQARWPSLFIWALTFIQIHVSLQSPGQWALVEEGSSVLDDDPRYSYEAFRHWTTKRYDIFKTAGDGDATTRDPTIPVATFNIITNTHGLFVEFVNHAEVLPLTLHKILQWAWDKDVGPRDRPTLRVIRFKTIHDEATEEAVARAMAILGLTQRHSFTCVKNTPGFAELASAPMVSDLMDFLRQKVWRVEITTISVVYSGMTQSASLSIHFKEAGD